jgi:hypothetical protein
MKGSRQVRYTCQTLRPEGRKFFTLAQGANSALTAELNPVDEYIHTYMVGRLTWEVVEERETVSLLKPHEVSDFPFFQ